MQIRIFGVGAIGSHLAWNLAADTTYKLTIIDYDKVEKRNIEAFTQFYLPSQVNLPKVQALEHNIYQWTNGTRINTIFHKVTSSSIPTMKQELILVDCFDRAATPRYINLCNNFINETWSWNDN